MTDSQNCMELCGDVVDAYREDGIRLERALAMLHKLTAPGNVEPYLSDLSRAVARGDGFVGTPLATYFGGNCTDVPATEDLREAWARDVLEDLTTHQWSTDLDDLEDEPEGEPVSLAALALAKVYGKKDRHCPICDNVLERRPRESFAEFARRETDSKSCAGKLRSQRNREAREAATA